MADQQTEIPVPESPPTLGPCRWCGRPAVGTIEVEKARYTTTANGTRVVARRAIEAEVCQSHWLSLREANPEMTRPEGRL